MDSLHRARMSFLDALAHSRLLDEEQQQAFVARHRLNDLPAEEIARSFVTHRLLTKFQARQLLAGRWRGLAFDHYRVLDSLSCGGMGEVFLARREDQNEQLAIKVLRGRYRQQPAALQRFMLEAEVLTTFRHPHLLKGIESAVYDDGTVRFPYLVMELIRGPNLYEWGLLNGLVPWPQACEMTRQAALGLHFVHEQGILHRDVKPGNLLLSPDGTLKVLDFGLARSFRELVEAPYPDASARAIDLLGLGATLTYAMNGSPHKNKGKEIANQGGQVPGDVWEIVRDLTSEHATRFQSALDVAEALAPWAKPFEVKIDYASLLEARGQARRQMSKLRSEPTPVDQIDGIEKADTTEDSQITAQRADVHRLQTLLRGMVQHADQQRKRDLVALQQLAEVKRTFEADRAAFQVQIAELAAQLKEQQSQHAATLASLEEEKKSAASAQLFLQKQLKVASVESQKHQQQSNVLRIELERVRQQASQEMSELRSQLSEKEKALAESQQGLRQLHVELAELTFHAEKLAALLPAGEGSEEVAGRSAAMLLPPPEINFWKAYQQACKPGPATLVDEAWGDEPLSEMGQEAAVDTERKQVD